MSTLAIFSHLLLPSLPIGLTIKVYSSSACDASRLPRSLDGLSDTLGILLHRESTHIIKGRLIELFNTVIYPLLDFPGAIYFGFSDESPPSLRNPHRRCRSCGTANVLGASASRVYISLTVQDKNFIWQEERSRRSALPASRAAIQTGHIRMICTSHIKDFPTSSTIPTSTVTCGLREHSRNTRFIRRGIRRFRRGR